MSKTNEVKIPSVEHADKTNGSVLKLTAYETSGTVSIDDKIVTLTQEDLTKLITDLNEQIQAYNKAKKKIKKKKKVSPPEVKTIKTKK